MSPIKIRLGSWSPMAFFKALPRPRHVLSAHEGGGLMKAPPSLIVARLRVNNLPCPHWICYFIYIE